MTTKISATKIAPDTIMFNGAQLAYVNISPASNNIAYSNSKPSLRIRFESKQAKESNVLNTLNETINAIFNENIEIFGDDDVSLADINRPMREEFIEIGKKKVKTLNIKVTFMKDEPPILMDADLDELSPEEFHNNDICNAAITLLPYCFEDIDKNLVRGIAAKLRVLQKTHEAAENDDKPLSNRDIATSFKALV